LEETEIERVLHKMVVGVYAKEKDFGKIFEDIGIPFSKEFVYFEDIFGLLVDNLHILEPPECKELWHNIKARILQNSSFD